MNAVITLNQRGLFPLLIARQVDDHNLVVWFDPERLYEHEVTGR
jgi:hypothetical protein